MTRPLKAGVKTSPHLRPWRIADSKEYPEMKEIVDWEGNLIAGLYTGYGLQGGLLDAELAEKVVTAVNRAGAWFGPRAPRKLKT